MISSLSLSLSLFPSPSLSHTHEHTHTHTYTHTHTPSSTHPSQALIEMPSRISRSQTVLGFFEATTLDAKPVTVAERLQAAKDGGKSEGERERENERERECVCRRKIERYYHLIFLFPSASSSSTSSSSSSSLSHPLFLFSAQQVCGGGRVQEGRPGTALSAMRRHCGRAREERERCVQREGERGDHMNGSAIHALVHNCSHTLKYPLHSRTLRYSSSNLARLRATA